MPEFSSSSMTSSMSDSHSFGAQAWFVSLVAALFFFYEFIQMNFFNALSPELMQSFGLDAEHLGYLSSIYFYANLIFLFPAGLILDRFSTRKIIILTMFICIVGTFSFAFAHDFFQAALCRFLTGIGSAFCFLSCIRLASRWFPSHRLALITGLVVTMAMLGGSVAQTPMTLLSEHFGWRHAVMIDSFLGLFLLAIISIIVKDFPPGYSELQTQTKSNQISEYGFLESMKISYLNKQNWLCGIYTCLMNSPISILGALWGSLYLESVHHLSAESASNISAMIFIGTIFGSPFAGFLSDRLKRRKRFMILGAILALADTALILYLPTQNEACLLLLFLFLGFITGAQIISYPTVAESNPPALTSSSVSVVSFTTISGYAIFQPLFGYFMDLHWNHLYINHQPIYHASDFSTAILMLPILFVIALLAALGVKETRALPFSFLKK